MIVFLKLMSGMGKEVTGNSLWNRWRRRKQRDRLRKSGLYL